MARREREIFLALLFVLAGCLKEAEGHSAWPNSAQDSLAGRQQKNGEPRMEMVRNSLDFREDANRDEEESSGELGEDPMHDFESMCLLKRQPSWKDNPTLFYFSHKTHRPETFGCKEDIRIELNVSSDAIANHDLSELDRMEERNERLIREKLLQRDIYDPALNTYMLIHGFMASWDSSNWMCKMKDAILNSSQANVFIVDWSGGSKPMLPVDYGLSVTNTQYVARELASFLRSLLESSGQEEATRVHMIGHSLGAHISGFVGFALNGTVGRITGLDPAGPCFEASQHRGGSEHYRLSPESGKFVLAMHTDGSRLGLGENCAHFDVWVNGGFEQPNCPARAGFATSLKNLFTGNLDLTCSHSFAHEILDVVLPVTDSLLSNIMGTFVADKDSSKLAAAGGSTGSLSADQLKVLAEQERCYDMAYECRSWQAFRAGECGFCLDGEPECLFVGSLGLNTEEMVLAASLAREAQLARPSEQSGGSLFHSSWDQPREEEEEEELSEDFCEEDQTFNDELMLLKRDQAAANESQLADSREMAPSEALNKLAELAAASKGRHFIKTAAQSPHCLYAYQLIIAVKPASDEAESEHDRKHYYLQIPLQQSGLLIDADTRKRLQDRLVQVSHKLNNNTAEYRRIRKQFAEFEQQSDCLETSACSQNNNYNFHTTLITFKSTELDEQLANCSDHTSVYRNNTWNLCRPIPPIREARLWSPSKGKLQQVQWVALNYMSGLSEKLRARYSHMLESNGDIMRLEDIEHELPRVDELSDKGNEGPESNSSWSKSLFWPIDCAFSSISDGGSSDTNLKCGKLHTELKYSLKLRPFDEAA